MRLLIIGILLAVFGPLAVKMREDVMSHAPPWVWRLIRWGCVLAGMTIFILSDPIYPHVTRHLGLTSILILGVALLTFILLVVANWPFKHFGVDAKDGKRNRDFLVRQLEEFIKERRVLNKQSVWTSGAANSNSRHEVEQFLNRNLSESHVKRFQEGDVAALEEMIKELLDDVDAPNPTKPKLEGEIQDWLMMPLIQTDYTKRINVWLRAYIFNSSDCPSGIKNFRWYFNLGATKYEAPYAEEGKLTQTYEGGFFKGFKGREFYNLVDFIRDHKTLTKGAPVAGHLHFILPYPELKDVAVVTGFVLIVTDTWGNDHEIRSKHVPLHPSERIILPVKPDSVVSPQSPQPNIVMLGEPRRTFVTHDEKFVFRECLPSLENDRWAIVVDFQNQLEVGREIKGLRGVFSQLTFRNSAGGETFINHGFWLGQANPDANFERGDSRSLVIGYLNDLGLDKPSITTFDRRYTPPQPLTFSPYDSMSVRVVLFTQTRHRFHKECELELTPNMSVRQPFA
jgi:hypothetical protein